MSLSILSLLLTLLWWAFVAVGAALGFLYARYLYWRTQFATAGNFLFGTAIELTAARKSNSVVEFRHGLYKKYGPIFQVVSPLALSRSIVICDPDWVQKVLVERNEPKAPEYKNVSRGIERGLFSLLDQERWQLVRRHLAHAFAPSSLKATLPSLEKGIHELLEILNKAADYSGKTVDLDKLFVSLTFDFIGESAFGLAFNSLSDPHGESSRFLREVQGVFEHILIFGAFPMMRFIRRQEYAKFLGHVKEMRRCARTLMAEATTPQHAKTAIWDALNGVADMDEEEKLDNFITFLVAGHDTTAHAMSFTFYCLITHPEAMQEAVKEVDAVLGDARIATMTHYPQLTYLTMCIKESARRHPTGNGPGRVLTETTTVNGLTIPKGLTVQTSLHVMHYIEKYYPDPERFDPYRFTKENEAARPRCSYLPFSQGPRDCIGKTMSMMEQVLVVATLLRHFTFTLAPGYEFKTFVGLVNRPLYGLPVVVKLRA